MPFPLTVLPLGAGAAGLVVAAATDLRTRIIPDGTVLWVLGMGALTRFLADGRSMTGGAVSLLVSLLVAAALFVPLAAMTHRGHIGGGDAKMIPAASLLVPAGNVFSLLLAVALAGGVLAGLYHVADFFRRCLAAPPGAQTPTAPTLPYGVAILAGVAFTLARELPNAHPQ
jgi:Flp pilus assembly protein protease CpaA